MLRVALTGGIGSGKSAAADAFRELGVPVIDTDRIARSMVETGQPGLNALVDAFGESILTSAGELDRPRLRERIFSDSLARERVDALLHPLILKEVAFALASIDAPYVIVEIPLLAETGLADTYDRVLVIDVPEATQLRRLKERDDVAPEQARAAIGAQATRAERLKIATDVIENTGDITALRSAVNDRHMQYLREAKRFASPPGSPQNKTP